MKTQLYADISHDQILSYLFRCLIENKFASHVIGPFLYGPINVHVIGPFLYGPINVDMYLASQMCSVNETAIEYVTALVDAEKKLKSCPPEVI